MTSIQVLRSFPSARLVYDTVDLHFLRETRIMMDGVGGGFNRSSDLRGKVG